MSGIRSAALAALVLSFVWGFNILIEIFEVISAYVDVNGRMPGAFTELEFQEFTRLTREGVLLLGAEYIAQFLFMFLVGGSIWYLLRFARMRCVQSPSALSDVLQGSIMMIVQLSFLNLLSGHISSVNEQAPNVEGTISALFRLLPPALVGGVIWGCVFSFLRTSKVRRTRKSMEEFA